MQLPGRSSSVGASGRPMGTSSCRCSLGRLSWQQLRLPHLPQPWDCVGTWLRLLPLPRYSAGEVPDWRRWPQPIGTCRESGLFAAASLVFGTSLVCKRGEKFFNMFTAKWRMAVISSAKYLFWNQTYKRLYMNKKLFLLRRDFYWRRSSRRRRKADIQRSIQGSSAKNLLAEFPMCIILLQMNLFIFSVNWSSFFPFPEKVPIHMICYPRYWIYPQNTHFVLSFYQKCMLFCHNEKNEEE
jgi:hypothetical protein